MDKAEARSVVETVLAPLRDLEYAALVQRFVEGQSEWLEQRADSGQPYRVQVQGFWDDKPHGPVRIMACADDYSAQRFIKPVCGDFIKAPDGSFVGE